MRNMIFIVEFNKMKDGVVIVNIVWGGVLVEEVFVEVLNFGKVLFCGLDVY